MAKTQLERALEHKTKGKNSGISLRGSEHLQNLFQNLFQNWLAVDGRSISSRETVVDVDHGPQDLRAGSQI